VQINYWFSPDTLSSFAATEPLHHGRRPAASLGATALALARCEERGVGGARERGSEGARERGDKGEKESEGAMERRRANE
jgi:hypothetical protein